MQLVASSQAYPGTDDSIGKYRGENTRHPERRIQGFQEKTCAFPQDSTIEYIFVRRRRKRGQTRLAVRGTAVSGWPKKVARGKASRDFGTDQGLVGPMDYFQRELLTGWSCRGRVLLFSGQCICRRRCVGWTTGTRMVRDHVNSVALS